MCSHASEVGFARTPTAALNPLLALCAVALTACVAGSSAADADQVAQQSGALRQITNEEALADFDELTQAFRSLYGAMSRKQARYGFTFEDIVRDYRGRVQAAKTESEYIGIFKEFVARFHDAHVALAPALNSEEQHDYRLPFLVMPIDNTFVVYAVDAPNAGAGATPVGLQRGDELLSIDGTPVQSLIDGFSKYAGAANPRSALHLAALRLTSRPSYLAQGIQANMPATVRVRGADGMERDVDLSWQESTAALLAAGAAPPHAGEEPLGKAVAVSAAVAELTNMELRSLGAKNPFYMTQQVRDRYLVTPVAPSPLSLLAFGVGADAAANVQVFAATYTFQGRRLLLLRMPSYVVEDETGLDATLGYIRALLTEQAWLTDGLVFDQTHNPGGSLALAQAIVSLLAPSGGNGAVQEMHADRRWIEAFRADAQALQVLSTHGNANGLDMSISQLQSEADTVDAAYSHAKEVTAPLPFPGIPAQLDASSGGVWQKPWIVLMDELSVSAADTLPLLVKANHLAPLFGARTMGAGGNVELAATLPNSQAQLTLSRGLLTSFDPSGAYPDERFIEDNGVAPDIAYEHTLADLRAGYVGYVEAFSRALVERIRF